MLVTKERCDSAYLKAHAVTYPTNAQGGNTTTNYESFIFIVDGKATINGNPHRVEKNTMI